MKIGKTITNLRNNKGLTQEQMADILEVKRARYNSWENDIAKPNIEMLDKLAKFHDVTTDSILGRNSDDQIIVTGTEISLSKEELQIFNEMRKYPVLFNDLQTNTEAKVKEIIKMWKFIKQDLQNLEDEDFGDDTIKREV
jgi:transcriptional regulator with XRE-family HTH domain